MIDRIRPYNGFDYIFKTNPTNDVNPGQLGVTWLNIATGEIFVCTNVTAGLNKWRGQLGTVIDSYTASEDFSLLANQDMAGRSSTIGGFAYTEDATGTKVLSGILTPKINDVSSQLFWDDGLADFKMVAIIPALPSAGTNRWAYVGFRGNGTTKMMLEHQVNFNAITMYSQNPTLTSLATVPSVGINVAENYPLEYTITCDGSFIGVTAVGPLGQIASFNVIDTYNQANTQKYLQCTGLGTGFTFFGVKTL